MNHFQELSLCADLARNLSRNGFQTPTPVQAGAIPLALKGHDIVATAQTGTGKTLAFVLPIIEKLLTHSRQSKIRVVIMSPTRELALQVQEVFLKLSAGTKLRSAVVVGGLSEEKQLHQIRQGAEVIIATPGRLVDFLKRRLVRLDLVHTIVLDEADRMLDMGFLPDMERIFDAAPEERQTLFFSATIEKSSARIIHNYLHEPKRVEIGSTTRPAEHVDLHLYEIDQDRKAGLLHHLLNQENGSFLVFARTKHGVDRLAKRLAGTGVKATRIHGDRTQSQRNQALRGFQQGDYRVLVATDVAARGIHVDGIAHVVNYDLPQVPEDFIHRVGRTGRAGARGVASTFGTPSERGAVRQLERALKLQLQRHSVSPEQTVLPAVSQDHPMAEARGEGLPGEYRRQPAAGPREFNRESRHKRPAGRKPFHKRTSHGR
jgi:ATP-dependent RNA helicase RhlE